MTTCNSYLPSHRPGYFALTAHAIPRGWRRIMMVTSAFHFERSRLIFEWMFGLQGAGVALRHDSASYGAGGKQNGLNGLRLESQNGADCSEQGLIGREADQLASINGNGTSVDEKDVGRRNGGPAARTPGSQGFSMHYLRAADEGPDEDDGMDADVIQVSRHRCRQKGRGRSRVSDPFETSYRFW